MTLGINNLNRWTLPILQNYVDPQLSINHCHASYIRGWCDMLDGRICNNPYTNNPFSKHHFYSKYKSYEAGLSDAADYLSTIQRCIYFTDI